MNDLTHSDLLAVVKRLPQDYEPFGVVAFDDAAVGPGQTAGQCSWGCRFYAALEGRLGADWGACCNPDSHRAGLLTFEHQGCVHYEDGPDYGEDEWMQCVRGGCDWRGWTGKETPACPRCGVKGCLEPVPDED